jgi:hypothetical protein
MFKEKDNRNETEEINGAGHVGVWVSFCDKKASMDFWQKSKMMWHIVRASL